MHFRCFENNYSSWQNYLALQKKGKKNYKDEEKDISSWGRDSVKSNNKTKNEMKWDGTTWGSQVSPRENQSARVVWWHKAPQEGEVNENCLQWSLSQQNVLFFFFKALQPGAVWADFRSTPQMERCIFRQQNVIFNKSLFRVWSPKEIDNRAALMLFFLFQYNSNILSINISRYQ